MTRVITDSTTEVSFTAGPSVWRIRFVFAGKERVRVLKLGQKIVVGSGFDADISISDPTVSARHCSLRVTSEGLVVSDLGSKNGIYVGAGRVSEALLSGSRASFCIGHTTVELEDHSCRVSNASMGLVGDSEAIKRVRATIRRFAPLRAPVLVRGESGTGKDLVARALHHESAREGHYHAVNVAALPDSLLDAELFGHQRGAFTGAVNERMGLFESADKGTLFLDEIADLSLSGQAKLLRVVEDGRIRALGAETERQVQVRIVSATCAVLEDRIETGEFRHDLFHRLAPLIIEIPPLRNRLSDIPLLATGYLERIADEVGQKFLLPGAIEVLKAAPWPGNVRELFGVLYRASALATGDALSPGDLSVACPQRGRCTRRLPAERALELLDIHGSISAAARAAGVPRSTFRSLLDRRKTTA